MNHTINLISCHSRSNYMSSCIQNFPCNLRVMVVKQELQNLCQWTELTKFTLVPSQTLPKKYQKKNVDNYNKEYYYFHRKYWICVFNIGSSIIFTQVIEYTLTIKKNHRPYSRIESATEETQGKIKNKKWNFWTMIRFKNFCKNHLPRIALDEPVLPDSLSCHLQYTRDQATPLYHE